ncbi:MAG: ribosomal L7Ae/L30e/S12e/Gadd45 family protein [Candidatus Woesearchaeota archaeon]
MMFKKVSKNDFDELIFKYRQRNSFVFGFNRVKKLLMNNSIEKIFVAKNLPENMRKDLEHYAKLANVEVLEVDMNNIQIGIYFKKLFGISVFGVVKTE